MKTSIAKQASLFPLLVGLLITAATYADASAPTRSEAKYEVHFLKSMIDHHAMAVMMGMLCEERAVHTELRELCHDIVAAQSAEIDVMEEWLQDWYGLTHEPGMNKGQAKQMEKLAALSGAEFEIAFMTMMIRHHEKAVREGMHCLSRAYHQKLKELCAGIVESQMEEIMVMESWLCEWYEICQ